MPVLKVAGLMAAACLVATPAMAAVSAFYDTGEQVSVILSSDAVASAVRQQPVTRLDARGPQADGSVLWILDASGCSLPVSLEPVPPTSKNGTPMVGKTTYRLKHVGTCK